MPIGIAQLRPGKLKLRPITDKPSIIHSLMKLKYLKNVSGSNDSITPNEIKVFRFFLSIICNQ